MFFKRGNKRPAKTDPFYRGTGPRKAPPPLEYSGRPPGTKAEAAPKRDSGPVDGTAPSSDQGSFY
jgi:hypothetical protein